MKSIGNIHERLRWRMPHRFLCHDEALAPGADGRNSIRMHTAHQNQPTLRQTMKENAASFMLLQNLKTIATARTATELRGCRKRGMGEHEDRGRRRLALPSKVNQAARVIRNGNLQDARQGGNVCEFRIHEEASGENQSYAARA